MNYDYDDIAKVFQTNLIDYAKSQGFDVIKSDNRAFKVQNHGGLFLFERGFYCHTTREKGNIIDFARKYQNLDFYKAVDNILGYSPAQEIYKPNLKQYEEKQEMILPEFSADTSIVLNYLVNKRDLDVDIVKDLIANNQIKQTKDYNNCTFIGYSQENIPKYCSLRGTLGDFRQDIRNSDKSYAFTMSSESNRVFVFEAPIDAISHATIFKLKGLSTDDNRIAMGGLFDKALKRFLEENKNITDIVFCFDNDYKAEKNYGQDFARACAVNYEKQGYKTFVQKPMAKDFNAELTKLKGLQKIHQRLAR